MEFLLPILMIVTFFVLLLFGMPVAVALASSALAFGWMGFGLGLFDLVAARIYGLVTNYTLLAIPLFVFMGVMLQKARLAEELLEVIGHLAGGMRGGMALAIILVGVLLGASTGIVAATVVTLGLLVMGTFLERGYSPSLACGTICASGTLGQIVPPSLVLILLSDVMGVPVGTLFAAAVVPALVLVGAYVAYLLLVGLVWPHYAPAIPASERKEMGTGELMKKVLVQLVPPSLLVLAVLGSILAGIAAPTEAAAVGGLGSVVIIALYGKFSPRLVGEAARTTLLISGMVFWILVAARIFGLAFRGLQGEAMMQALFTAVPGGTTGIILLVLLIFFILGFFLEWIEITYVVLPLFLPIIDQAGIDRVWMAMLLCVNLQTSFLTPPFGWSVIFLRGVVPSSVTTGHIYKGVIPFIALQLVVLAMVYAEPKLATWLPTAIGW